jgi:hypothetical protein
VLCHDARPDRLPWSKKEETNEKSGLDVAKIGAKYFKRGVSPVMQARTFSKKIDNLSVARKWDVNSMGRSRIYDSTTPTIINPKPISVTLLMIQFADRYGSDDFSPELADDFLSRFSGGISGHWFEHYVLCRGFVVGDRYFFDRRIWRSIPDNTRGTVMTAMTLANIAKGTLVTAEILDPKMDQYLKIAQVSEIIYSREYSRLLLGNAAGGTGISNILFDLLDPNTDTYLTTLPIPSDLIGRTYAELREQIETGSTRQILLGILENTGNSHTIKELALRQAQKTPDMEKLVMNLKTVKHLKCNHPVFNPPPSTLLHEGSMAMVIGKRKGRGVQHVQSEEEVSRTAA